jgi:hypothetical protein
MRIAVFYMSFNQAPGRRPIPIQIGDGGEVSWVYVRAEQVDAPNAEMGLDKAKPQEDENIMNAHQVP